MSNSCKNSCECSQKESIFTAIINRKLPATILYEDDLAIVIEDKYPQAPVHLLVIPKKPIESISHIQDDDIMLMGHLMKVVRDVARQQKLQSGYRVVVNTGSDACQAVFHLHLHILAGRKLSPNAG
ncbi:hypothetical protein HZS_8001 [Henneguya salminicola]|nr:hypothetical protein HZS_8001 [Henneguya salminicola]